MKTKSRTSTYLIFMLVMLLMITNSCKKDEAAKAETICFIMQNNTNTALNVRINGDSYDINNLNLSHATTVDVTTSTNHVYHFYNIKTIEFGMVASFNVTINGKEYSFPKDKCTD